MSACRRPAWIVTDAPHGLRSHGFHIGSDRALDAADLAGCFPRCRRWSVRHEMLHGGTSEGVELLTVQADDLELQLLPTRGLGIWRGRCGSTRLGWDSPVERPVHPAFVNLAERGGLGWLHGFNEWLCRCGLESHGPPCVDGGMTLTLHGRCANIPAHNVRVEIEPADPQRPDDTGALRVVGTLDEGFLFGPRLRLESTLTLFPGLNRFRIDDRISNLKSTPGEFELLYHINQGRTLLGPGAALLAPVRRLAPRDARGIPGVPRFHEYEPPTPGYAEQVFYMELHGRGEDRSTVVMLRAPDAAAGLALRFSLQQLPWFVMWKNSIAERDGYVTGLEPAVNLPNTKSFERQQGRVRPLPAGGSYSTRIDFELLGSAGEVAAVAREIAELQALGPAELRPDPDPEWSPG